MIHCDLNSLQYATHPKGETLNKGRACESQVLGSLNLGPEEQCCMTNLLEIGYTVRYFFQFTGNLIKDPYSEGY